MKKLLPVAIIIMAFVARSTAQASFSLTPKIVHVTVHDTITDAEADNTIKNLTNSALTLKWTRTVYCIIPDTAETQICDPNICYGTATSSKSFTLAPNVSAPIVVHFLKERGAAGSAIVQLHFEKTTNPADSLNSWYYFNNCTVTGTETPLPVADVQVFPNPVSTYFTLGHAADVSEIRLFTVSGRLAATYAATPDNLYLVANLPAGTYVLALYDRQGRAFQAQKLLKRE
jgi:hypothetical protein